MITRRRLLGAVPAGVLLTATGCDLMPSTAPTPSTDPTSSATLQKALEQILARRTVALAEGDEAAWMADLDPSAAGLVDEERWRFNNLRQLRPAKYHLHLQLLTGYRDTGAMSAEVGAVMRLTFDDDQSMSASTYTVAATPDGAHITGITPTTAASEWTSDVQQRYLPWELQPMQAAHADEITVLAAAGSGFTPSRYLPAAQRAVRFVRGIWRQRPQAPGFLILLADDEQFYSWFGARTSPRSVGFAHFPRIVADDGGLKSWNRAKLDAAGIHKASAGARIVLKKSALSRGSDLYRTLVHEITHALTPQLIRPGITDPDSYTYATGQSIWLVEGFAHYVEDLAMHSRDTTITTVRRGWKKHGPTGDLVGVENQHFYSDDAHRTAFHYALSSLYFHAAEAVSGRQAACDLFWRLAARSTQLTANSALLINQYLRETGIDSDRYWTIVTAWTR